MFVQPGITASFFIATNPKETGFVAKHKLSNQLLQNFQISLFMQNHLLISHLLFSKTKEIIFNLKLSEPFLKPQPWQILLGPYHNPFFSEKSEF